MPRLHICNTFFEKELESNQERSLSDWMHSHPVVLQLQFLPLLYAKEEDKILVTKLPENPDPRLCLMDQPPRDLPIEHWGPSKAIATWAKKWGIPYPTLDWEKIRRVNSKIFSFNKSPKLPGAQIVHSDQELSNWMEKVTGPKILKTPFGTAGNGHLNPNVKQLYIYPLIAEPWVKRVLDFSTQWENGKLVGVTIFENEENGTYKGTSKAEVDPIFLEEHLKIAGPLVEEIDIEGQLGIDAFIYLQNGQKKLHPVVEINVRKTMSWVFLQTGKKRLHYTTGKEGELPCRLGKREFSRNIKT